MFIGNLRQAKLAGDFYITQPDFLFQPDLSIRFLVVILRQLISIN